MRQFRPLKESQPPGKALVAAIYGFAVTRGPSARWLCRARQRWRGGEMVRSRSIVRQAVVDVLGDAQLSLGVGDT
jgi:hypothetical protein